MVEWVQILAMPAMVVGMFLRRTERRLVRQMRDVGANSPQTATSIPSLSRVARWQWRRLRSYGAIHETAAGLCYFDEQGYASLRAARRRRAAIIVPIVLLLVLFAMLAK